MRTAAYCRFSSDKQLETSIEDQLRNVRAHCDRVGWPAPIVFRDLELSGARADRPGYRAMLDAGARSEFDVLLVDDTYRLARDQVELPRAIRELKFRGIRVVGVSDGFDTDREGYKLEMGMRAIMGEAYLDNLAKTTHRGLTGRALKGFCAGGLPYGYRVTSTGERSIDPAQREIVCEIFQKYSSGTPPRSIAAALNARGVRAGRGGTWCASAIYGDMKRGIGILANQIYRGRMIWNRSHWPKDLDGRRRRVERPESEWIITEHPELRIVDEALWQRVQARFAEVRHRMPSSRHPGARPKYLLSGLMKCGSCGATMVVVDRYRYGCAANKDRGPGVCTNGIRVARSLVEDRLLQVVREDLLSEQAFQAFAAGAREVLKTGAPDVASARRALLEAERVRANLVENIRQGVVSPAVRAALLQAEADVAGASEALERLQAFQPAQLLPRAREVQQRLVAKLGRVDDVVAARDALREILGEVRLIPEAGHLVAELDGGMSKIDVVAGARFGLNLTAASPTRIPLKRARILPSK